MTASEALTLFSALRNNTVTESLKKQWLSEIDAKIALELFAPRSSEEVSYFLPTSPLTDTLCAPDEYGEIYPAFLVMKLDYMNGEILRYNNSATVFNNLYYNLSNYVNRKTAVLKKTPLKGCDELV